jgi:hypothetical protein
VKKFRRLEWLPALTLAFLLVSCSVLEIRVARVEPRVISLGVERLELKNCESEEYIYKMLSEDYQVEKIIRISDQGVEQGSVSTRTIPPDIKSQLIAKVDETYQEVYKGEVENLNLVELEGKGDSIRLFRIEILEKSWASKIAFRMEGKAFETDYVYELHVPNYLGFWETNCLG